MEKKTKRINFQTKKSSLKNICGICCKEFCTVQLIRRHIKNFHLNNTQWAELSLNNPNIFEGTVIDEQEISTYEEFIQSYSKCKCIDNVPESKFYCRECRFAYKNQEQLNKHIADYDGHKLHRQNLSEQNRLELKKQKLITQNEKGNISIEEKLKRLMYINSCEREKMYYCKECDFKFFIETKPVIIFKHFEIFHENCIINGSIIKGITISEDIYADKRCFLENSSLTSFPSDKKKDKLFQCLTCPNKWATGQERWAYQSYRKFRKHLVKFHSSQMDSKNVLFGIQLISRKQLNNFSAEEKFIMQEQQNAFIKKFDFTPVKMKFTKYQFNDISLTTEKFKELYKFYHHENYTTFKREFFQGIASLCREQSLPKIKYIKNNNDPQKRKEIKNNKDQQKNINEQQASNAFICNSTFKAHDNSQLQYPCRQVFNSQYELETHQISCHYIIDPELQQKRHLQNIPITIFQEQIRQPRCQKCNNPEKRVNDLPDSFVGEIFHTLCCYSQFHIKCLAMHEQCPICKLGKPYYLVRNPTEYNNLEFLNKLSHKNNK